MKKRLLFLLYIIPFFAFSQIHNYEVNNGLLVWNKRYNTSTEQQKAQIQLLTKIPHQLEQAVFNNTVVGNTMYIDAGFNKNTIIGLSGDFRFTYKIEFYDTWYIVEVTNIYFKGVESFLYNTKISTERNTSAAVKNNKISDRKIIRNWIEESDEYFTSLFSL